MSSDHHKKRLEELLHAYELGMLDDQQREEFELLLLEDDELFERIRRFEATSALLRDSAAVRQTAADLAASAEAAPSQTNNYWRRFAPASVVMVVLLLVLLLKDWQLEFRPSQEAVAGKEVLIVQFFDNLVEPNDPQALGAVTTNLLITDIMESSRLQVVSSQYLRDLTAELSRQNPDASPADLTREAAERVGAAWMLTGSILQTEPHLILTWQVVKSSTGQAVASQRVEGAPGETVFALVDKLTEQVRAELDASGDLWRQASPRVADVTTSSQDAYRYFLDGVDYYDRYYTSEARLSFERALSYDSAFAMAYYFLARTKNPALIDSAAKYAGRATRKDQLLIGIDKAAIDGDTTVAKARLEEAVRLYPDDKEVRYLMAQQLYVRGQYREALGHFKAAVACDSTYRPALNYLAYTYDKLGKADSAMWAIDRYIALAPHEANPYDSKGDIAANNGLLEVAIASYQKATAVKPDFMASLTKLGLMSLCAGDYQRADSCFQVLAVAPTRVLRNSGRLYLAYVPLVQGKLEQSLEVINNGLIADALETELPATSQKHMLKALIHAEQGGDSLAVLAVRQAVLNYQRFAPNDRQSYRYLEVELLARFGRLAEAREITEDIREFLEKQKLPLFSYYYASGAMALAEHKYDSAVRFFEQADSTGLGGYYTRFNLGRSYLAAGQRQTGIAVLEKLQGQLIVDRAQFGIWDAESHYLIGMALEELGRRDEAVHQYQRLKDRWGECDSDIPWLAEALARLDRLTQQP